MPFRSFLSLLVLAAICVGCGADQTAQAPGGDEPSAESASASQDAPAANTTGAASSTSGAASSTSAQGDSAGALAENDDREIYTIDPASSEVYWTISSAGPLARFGHSHVISAETFSGTVAVAADDPAASSFELEIPVGDLVIDDPELRSRLGEDFESVPSEDDKAGTRANMLSEDLLMGDTYPVVRVRGGGPQEADAGSRLPVEIEIVGNTYALELPGEVVVGDDSVEASGEFALEHGELGLTPFSALGGAVQVGSTIEFTYRIRAVR